MSALGMVPNGPRGSLLLTLGSGDWVFQVALHAPSACVFFGSRRAGTGTLRRQPLIHGVFAWGAGSGILHAPNPRSDALVLSARGSGCPGRYLDAHCEHQSPRWGCRSLASALARPIWCLVTKCSQVLLGSTWRERTLDRTAHLLLEHC